ncbi:hypothetical protein CC2G_014438 [Coprinopsis cinerea AmutBmut pab1-1]|nr:hypothetical protein CC2G_014438 [Coprinopsis cinerea AmutBmut pab1-1]
MSTFFRLYLALSLLLLRVAAQSLSVSSVGVIGTGCEPGTAAVDVDNAANKIRVRVKDFSARGGPGVAISENRRNCQVTLGVKVPAGYSFSVDNAVVRAAYSASSGTRLVSSSTAYFQGELQECSGTSVVNGPVSRGESTLVNNLSPARWSPCGSSTVVNINTDVRVDTTGQSSGSIAVNGVWESNIVWRKC